MLVWRPLPATGPLKRKFTIRNRLASLRLLDDRSCPVRPSSRRAAVHDDTFLSEIL